jgi:hypothetical protein
MSNIRNFSRIRMPRRSQWGLILEEPIDNPIKKPAKKAARQNFQTVLVKIGQVQPVVVYGN